MTKNKAMMMVGLVLLLVLAITSQSFASDAKIGVKLELFSKDGTALKTDGSLSAGAEIYLDVSLNCTGAAANEYINSYGICIDYRECRTLLERVTIDGNPPNETNQFTELTTGTNRIVTGQPAVTSIANSNTYGFAMVSAAQATGKLVNSVLNDSYKHLIRYHFKTRTAISVDELEFIVCREKITPAPILDTGGGHKGEANTESSVSGYLDGKVSNSFRYDFVETNFPDVPPPVNYKVKFESNGGSSVSEQTVRSGNKATKPTDPQKDNYTFNNWYSDTALNTGYNFDSAVTKDITLYAKWDPLNPNGPFTVTFNSDGGTPTPSTQTVTAGNKATLPTLPPTKTGFTFSGWYVNTTDAAAYDFSKVLTGNLNLTAKWISNEITKVSGTANNVDFTKLEIKNYIEVTGKWAKTSAGNKESMTVDNATITVPDNFCVGLAEIKDDDILKIYLGGDWAKEAYRVYITKNDVNYAWFNPGYFITLVIDSALGDASNADCLVAYDSTDSDKIVTFSRFLLSTKKLTVRIMKTADIGLKTNPVSFTDTAGLWMDEAVKFMAARDIVRGVGNNRFDFRSNMSIRDYVLMSMRMFGYKVDDVADAINYYQVAWDMAKNLGLLANIDNPNSDPITRQQMFLITARLLNKFNFIPAKVEGNSLANFTDGDKVADYAKDLINSLVAKGLVHGDAGKPTLRLPDKSTRAEAAQFLYNIFKDIM